MATPKLTKLKVNEIRIDGGTQPRAEIDESYIGELVEAITEHDARFPPVDVYADGKTYWLADGFHRLHAHRKVGTEKISAKIFRGSRRDAILHSVGANATHGLRRSNVDKREAVRTLLEDEEWGKWSDREIARRCGVDHKTVGRLRDELTGEIPQSTARIYSTRHGTQATMNTERIGKKVAAGPTPGKAGDGDEGQGGEPPVLALAKEQTEGLTDLQQDIQSVRRQVESYRDEPVGGWLKLQRIDIDLKNVWTALKFAMPHAVCPYCQGEKCDNCRQTGWMPKDVFERVPAELRT
ncbi:MAG: ParB N-terminal domain-containing protein [Phycisphaeraceae bacterium]